MESSISDRTRVRLIRRLLFLFFSSFENVREVDHM